MKPKLFFVLFLVIKLLNVSLLWSQTINLDSINKPGYYCNSPVIVNGSLILIAYGGTSWTWTGPNSFFSTKANNSLANVDSTFSGTYFLAISDSINDTAYYYSVDVNVFNPPGGIKLQFDWDNICDNTPTQFEGPANALSYDWSVNPNALNISNHKIINPIITFSTAQSAIDNYVVTLVVTTPLGTTTFTKTVNVHHCCTDEIVGSYSLGLGKLLVESQAASTFPVNANILPMHLAIAGSFSIDQDFSFNSNITDDITMVEESWITNPIASIRNLGFLLELDDVKIHGCIKSWVNINAANTTEAKFRIINQSDISDAYAGLGVINSVVQIYINNCDFHDNEYGIHLCQSSAPKLFEIKGTRFFGTANQLLLGSDSGHALYGIFFEDCPLPFYFYNLVPNEFHELQYGIYAQNTSVSLFSDAAKFYDIPKVNFTNGSALYGENNNSPLGSYPLIEKFGNQTQDDFENCDNAIYLRKCDAHIADNYIGVNSSVNIGIKAELCNGEVNILNNKIYNFKKSGISLFQMNLGGLGLINYINVENNELTTNNNVNLTDNNKVGIRINGPQFTPQQFKVKGNVITIGRGEYGILNMNGINVDMEENTVYLNDYSINHAGIGLFGTDNNVVKCNHISGVNGMQNNGQAGSRFPIGIRTAASINGIYGFNDTRDLYTGMSFEEDCSMALSNNITRNSFSNENVGLYYNPNAQTPSQYNTGNEWNNSFVYKGYNTNMNYVPNQYVVGSPNSKYDPTGFVNPWDWIRCDQNLTTSDAEYPCSLPDKKSNSNDSILTRIDTTIAQNKVQYSYFQEEQAWNAARKLYHKLSTDESLVGGNLVMTQFMDSVSQTTVSQFEDFEKFGKDAVQASPSLMTLIVNLKQQLKALKLEINHLDSLLYSHPSVSDSLEFCNNLFSLYNNYRSISSELKAAFAGYHSFLNGQLNYVISENQQLVAETAFETNEKLINDIYYQTIAKGIDVFTPSQLSDLWFVASQCPVSGGKAVYLARSIYAKISDTLFDDHLLCLENGIIKTQNLPRKTDENQTFLLYPNPANQTVTLSWNKLENINARIEICNILGELVIFRNISMTGGQLELDISNLPVGIYQVMVKDSGHTCMNRKLSIVK